MSYETIYLISQNTPKSETLCCISGIISVIICSIYVPGNMEIVCGEGEWVIFNHPLPHLCVYSTAASSTFNQGFEKAGYVQRHT